MTVFHRQKGQPVLTLDDWKQLGDSKNWMDGRSAKRLAETWFPAGGFQTHVSALLNAEAELA